MLAGRLDGRTTDLNSVFEAVGRVQAGTLDEAGLKAIECSACPTCGSCSGMFTANSMNCLAEIIGMALPGNGTIPAPYSERLRYAKSAGVKVMDVLAADLQAARYPDRCRGGQRPRRRRQPGLQHQHGAAPRRHRHRGRARLPAGAHQRGRGPRAAHLPAGARRCTHHMEDLYFAGGIQAVMKRLIDAGLMDGSARSVAGGTVAEAVADARVVDDEVIRPLSRPYHATGGLAVLFGNLAPYGRRGQRGRRGRRDAAPQRPRPGLRVAKPTPSRPSPPAPSSAAR